MKVYLDVVAQLARILDRENVAKKRRAEEAIGGKIFALTCSSKIGQTHTAVALAREL